MNSFFPPHHWRRQRACGGLSTSLLSLQPLLISSPDISFLLQIGGSQTLDVTSVCLFHVQCHSPCSHPNLGFTFEYFSFLSLSVSKYIKKYLVGKIGISLIPIFIAFFLITLSILYIFLVFFSPLSNFFQETSGEPPEVHSPPNHQLVCPSLFLLRTLLQYPTNDFSISWTPLDISGVFCKSQVSERKKVGMTLVP